MRYWSFKSRGMSIFVAREGWQTSTLTPSLASVSQAGRIKATFYWLRNWPGGQEQSGGGGESVRNLRNGEKTISVHSGHLPSLVIQLVTPQLAEISVLNPFLICSLSWWRSISRSNSLLVFRTILAESQSWLATQRASGIWRALMWWEIDLILKQLR